MGDAAEYGGPSRVEGRGKRVGHLRRRAGLTQPGAARKSGVSEREIQYIEGNDDYNPKVDTLERLAAAYGPRISRSQFFGTYFLLEEPSGRQAGASRAGVLEPTDLAVGRALFRTVSLKSGHWEGHLARARIAESLLSSVPREALRVAWQVADGLIQLGRYGSAEAEIDRILAQYPWDLDIEVTVGLLYQRARLRFAARDPLGAERWSRAAVALLEKSGHIWTNGLAHHPLHFLARHLGCEGKWQEAEFDYSSSLDHHMRNGAFHHAGFDVLWRAQMRVERAEMMGEHYDPTAEFDLAEELSGHIHAYRHLQLERARVQLRDGEIVDPREAFEEWQGSGYAKGVARYFCLQMDQFCRFDKVNDAVEAGVAALLTLPADRNLTATVWRGLFELRGKLRSPITDLEILRERAHARRGSFRDADPIARDHIDEIEQILERLRRPEGSARTTAHQADERGQR